VIVNEQSDNVSPADRHAVFVLVCLAACLAYGLFFLLVPPVVRFVLSDGQSLIVWREHLVYKCRWLLIGAGAILSFLTFAGNRARKAKASPGPRMDAIFHYLIPVSLLPWFGAIMLLGGIVPYDLVSNAVLFGPALVVSLIVAKIVERRIRGDGVDAGKYAAENGNVSTREWTLLIFVVSTIFYACLGCYIALVAGEHVGDEGQYLAQARSLYYDHDLDVKNNFLQEQGQFARDYGLGDNLKGVSEAPPQEIAGLLSFIHVSLRSRNGHWYSIHPYGLPLLLAPFWPLGIVIRYLILGIIGALGNVAMYKIARGLGTGRNAAMTTVLCFGASYYWAVYSARALPEVLGATLLCWVFWSVLTQNRRPWLTVVAGSACCSYLPMAHDRFVPLSLMGFGFYGLFGLFSAEKWPRKIFRLAVFTALTSVGYGIYAASQWLMFEKGLKFELGGALVDYPLGMWGAIADYWGVTSVLPAFMWIAAALIALFFLRSVAVRYRLYAVAVGITFFVCLATSCANRIYIGGSCVPGRYVLVVVPLLVPGAAYVFDRTTSTARWWFCFLSGISTMMLVMVTVFLPVIGRGFIQPIQPFIKHVPILASFYNPHASFLYSTKTELELAATVYVAGGILLTTLMLFLHEKGKRLSILCVLFVMAFGAFSHVLRARLEPAQRGTTATLSNYLVEARRERLFIPVTLDRPRNLFDISQFIFNDFARATSTVGVTTIDLGTRMRGNMVSQPRLEANDWAERGCGWTTLTGPFEPIPGQQILHMAGTVEGNATPIMALRQGAKTIFEGPVRVDNGRFQENYVFSCRKSGGDLYILMRLTNGEGTLILKELYWSPYCDSLVKDTNILLPENVSVVEK
jgi:hypothetical protein